MNVEIAERLAARRKEAGLSQEVLAERLGVSRQAVSKWERSESSPDTDNLIALAKLYGVSLDDLLYVDGSIEDDVEFEKEDRAAARTVGADGPKPEQPVDAKADDGQVPPAPEEPGKSGASSGWASKGKPDAVRIGLDGIHVLDGEDYVHVTWREGVHVKDSAAGEEVHVGWDGVHVKEGRKRERAERRADRAAARHGGRDDSWVAAGDDEGNTVAWDGCGVNINGEHFDDWRDAQDKYGYSHHCWSKPKYYTVNGVRFDTLDDARARYGDEVGKSIPVRKHYGVSAWLKFPYPLVAIIAYLLIGFTAGEWGLGLFVFFTVPVYYMLGHAIGSKKYAHFVGGVYPIAAVAWFLYMAFVLNAPHPAWVAFLTIPIVEWAVHSISRWWRLRKREDDVIDVEAGVR